MNDMRKKAEIALAAVEAYEHKLWNDVSSCERYMATNKALARAVACGSHATMNLVLCSMPRSRRQDVPVGIVVGLVRDGLLEMLAPGGYPLEPTEENLDAFAVEAGLGGGDVRVTEFGRVTNAAWFLRATILARWGDMVRDRHGELGHVRRTNTVRKEVLVDMNESVKDHNMRNEAGIWLALSNDGRCKFVKHVLPDEAITMLDNDGKSWWVDPVTGEMTKRREPVKGRS